MKKLKGAISTSGYKKLSPDKSNDFNVIPGKDITMKNVDNNLTLYPVKFNDSHLQVSPPITAYPGQDYSFPGHDAVVEVPEFKRGGGFPQGMTPLNTKLFNKLVKQAKKKFKVFPSNQVLTWVNSQYKHQGGDYAFDYNYNYKQQGGDMKNVGTPPTADQFFNFGVVPIGPAGFYNYGGQPCYECMQSGGNWIQNANADMERKGTKGAFTEYCGGKVTDDCIERGLKSSNPTTRKRAGFAKAMRSIAHKQNGGDVPAQYKGLGDVVQRKKVDFRNSIRNQTMMALAAQEADAMEGLHSDLTKFMKQMGGQSEPQPVFDANMYNQEIYSQAAEPNNMWGEVMNLGNTVANMQMNKEEYYTPQAQYGYSMPQYMPGNMLIPMNYAPYRPNPYYRMTNASRSQTSRAPIAWDPSKTSALSSVEMKYGIFNKRSPRKVTMTFQTPYSKKQAMQGNQPMVPVQGASGGADMNWQSSDPGYQMPVQNPMMIDPNQQNPAVSSPEFKYGGLLKFMQLAGQVGLPFNPVDLANNPSAYNPYDPNNQQMYSPQNTGTDYFQRNPMDFNGQTMDDNTSNLGEDDGFTTQQVTFKRRTAYNPEDVVNATYAGANALASIGENRQRKEYEKKLKQRMNADAVFTPMAMGMNSRGDYDINSGLFRPHETVPVQFRAYTGVNYKKGGEYYMSDAEIQNFLKMGGQIEIID